MNKINQKNRIQISILVLGVAFWAVPSQANNDCEELDSGEERAACHYGYGRGYLAGQAGTIGNSVLVSSGAGYGLLVPRTAGSAGDMGAPAQGGPGTEGFEILYVPIGDAGTLHDGQRFLDAHSAAGETPWSQVLKHSAIDSAFAAADEPVSIQLFKNSGMFVQQWNGDEWDVTDEFEWQPDYGAVFDAIQSAASN